jgi:hypothetical protein
MDAVGLGAYRRPEVAKRASRMIQFQDNFSAGWLRSNWLGFMQEGG